jgi:predicted ATPase
VIDEIFVSGYKSLMMDSPIATSKLNVLVGANASGKSSLLQTLLLLRQSSNEFGIVTDLHLSGPLYEGGTAIDILHPEAQHHISIHIASGKEKHDFHFEFKRDAERVNKRRLEGATKNKALPSNLGARGASFCYLNAERIGPRVSYPLPSEESDLAGPVGKVGEFTTSRLNRGKEGQMIGNWSDDLIAKLCKAPFDLDGIDIEAALKDSGGRLDLVANIVLGWIIPGAEFLSSEEDGTDSAQLRFIRDPSSTRVSTRATHVGFGLSYALPIIVGGLALDGDGLLLVENPEAHLHPFGQSRIGAFLAALAATGRQVFVETHSDHVINGIRLAIKYGVTSDKSTLFNYFHSLNGASSSFITQIGADDAGALDDWPDGFFDQNLRDLSRL